MIACGMDAEGPAMNPDFLQALWTFIVTVACYAAVATELVSPKFETMPSEEVEQAIAIYDDILRLEPDSPNIHLRRGFARLTRYELENAIADFDLVICHEPDSAQAYLLRGSARKELKRFDQAITDTDEAIRLSPASRQAFLQRGLIWHLKHEFDKAMADYDEAIRLDPDHGQSYAARSLVWLSKKQQALALADIEKAIELEPDASNNYSNRGCIHVEKQNSEQAFADFAEAIRLNPRNANAYVNRGLFHNHRKEWDLAIQDLNEGIRLSPINTVAYYQRGLSFRSKGIFPQAIADFDQVLTLLPDDHDAHLQRGASLMDAKRFKEAIRDFSDALRLTPENVATLVMRGRCYFFIEDFDHAIEDINEAIRLEPGRANFWMHRGAFVVNRSFKRDTKSDLDQAIADYNEAVRLDSHDPLIYMNRAVAYYNQKKFGLAALDAIASDELNPRQIPVDHMKDIANLSKQAADRILVGRNDENTNDLLFATACFDRGVAHYLLKRDEAALKDLSDAILLDPGYSLSYAFRGRIHLKKKQWDAAVQDFGSAIHLKPDDATLWMARGEARAAKQEYVTACDDFREAIRLDPKLIRAFAHRGAAWQAMQEWEEAIADYDNVTHGGPLYAHTSKDHVPEAKPAAPAAVGAKTDSKIVNVFDMVTKPSKGIFSLSTDNAPSGLSGLFNNEGQTNTTTTTTNTGGTLTAQPATNQTPNPGLVAGSDVELDPLYLKVLQNRAECHEAISKWTKAIADYQTMIGLAPAEGLAYRRIAWLKATCVAADIRNGEDAVSFATQATQRSKRSAPENLVVLAAAYAETGDFAKAIEYQSQACDLVVRSSEKEFQDRRQHFASLEFQRSLDEESIPNTDDSAVIKGLFHDCEQSGWKDAGLIELLADAYADAGQFSQAIEFHEKAYTIVSEARDKPFLERLELYRAGKPYRDTSRPKESILANDH